MVNIKKRRTLIPLVLCRITTIDHPCPIRHTMAIWNASLTYKNSLPSYLLNWSHKKLKLYVHSKNKPEFLETIENPEYYHYCSFLSWLSQAMWWLIIFMWFTMSKRNSCSWLQKRDRSGDNPLSTLVTVLRPKNLQTTKLY